jgi:trimethylamine--corrinoid protein Co-methyltransferase
LKLSRIEILSKDDIDVIYTAALHVLEKVGIQYMYEPTLMMLKENGCEINLKRDIAKIPEGLVEDCLRYTPRQIVFYGRDPSKDLRAVAGERAHVTADTRCRHLLTFPYNKYKPYTTEDVAHKTRLCDYLPLIEGVRMPGEGGRDYPEEVCSDWCATDPLQWSADGCKSLELYAKSGAPTGVVVGGPVIGATSPSSFAGLLTHTLAEWLSGLVIVQLYRKGTPIWLGANGPVIDMKKLFWYRVSSTSAIWSTANVQLAHNINIPITGGGVSGSESKTVNSQWGIEGLFPYVPLLAGADFVSCGSYVGLGQAVSYEGLLLSHEAIKSVHRILEGVKVTPEALALDLFEKEGPGGKFIGYRHTLKWYLKEHVPPELFDKDVWQKWEEMGRKDIVERAHEKVVEILNTHEVEPLPKSTLYEIHKYQKAYRKKVELGELLPGKPTEELLNILE